MREHTFDIGLVMAGAVSAGAYTAGVIDFLLQALKAWEDAKKDPHKKAPPHDVQIKVMAGASAGGMSAAILTAMINDTFSAITSLPEREPTPNEVSQNKLYNAWVEQIDITKLLGENDLQGSTAKVTSLLDSTVLDEIAENTIQFNPDNRRPHYIADPLHLYLTLTNLQGVPYDIKFKGRSDKEQSVSEHTDFFHFILSDQPGSKEAAWLDPHNDRHPTWNLLKNVALATGAFPGGLAPRIINRPFSNYDLRTWPIPQPPDPDHPSAPRKCIKMEHIEPGWPTHQQDQFHFLSVDGGVMDNEPLELARRALAGNKLFNPRKASHTDRSIIMIDPFPSDPPAPLRTQEELADYDIVGVMMQLLGSLIDQSRFKPDELILANAEDVYSRFLIAPTRSAKDGSMAKHPIASGFLNGFGGFFSKRFRMHDFQLGRRNCQQFLRRYFALPVEDAKLNPVFESYSEADFERFSFSINDKAYLPIIPLMDELKQEVAPLQWASLAMNDAELNAIQKQVRDRTKVVINRLLDQYIQSGLTRRAAKIIAWFKRKAIVDKIMHTIIKELKTFDLKS